MVIINIISDFISNFVDNPVMAKFIDIAGCIKDHVKFNYYRVTDRLKKIFGMRNKRVFAYGHPARYRPKVSQYYFWEDLW